MSTCVLIVAGGASRRFGGRNKLLLDISPGISVLEYSVRAAWNTGIFSNLVVAASENGAPKARSILAKLGVRGEVVPGGDERSDSVRNGLAACKGEKVLVHDAARPFASSQLFSRVCDAISTDVGVVPVVLPTDTLYKTDNDDSVTGTMERGTVACAQTPQGFPLEMLVELHRRAIEEELTFTDDGSLLLHYGKALVTVQGERRNFKITYPADLEVARIMTIKAGIMGAMKAGG